MISKENYTMKLDLGCGRNKKIGFIGIDIKDWKKLYPKGEFIQQDITKGIPFKDNEIDEINIANCLEHLTNESFIFVMEEMHRVLKPNGKLTILTPHFSSFTAFSPHHKLTFNSSSLMEFTHPHINNKWYKVPLFNLIKKKTLF